MTSLAAVAPVWASLMLPPAPFRAKDFAMFKKDGVYHLFYIRNNTLLPAEQTEKNFGHAISFDLYNWAQLDSVLEVRDSSWDNLHVWAPNIVESDGVYYMFYTGVTLQPGSYDGTQRMGVAVSTDLFTWNRLDSPVFSCAQVPWTNCDTVQTVVGFRDPFVMPDPAKPGQWLMYYSTYPSSEAGASMEVGVAASSGDLTQWTDLGPLAITDVANSFNTVVESPHLWKHGGLWYLFFTTNAGQPLSFCTGTDPVGSPSAWIYRGRLFNMIRSDTFSWFASEHFTDGTHEYFCFVNGNRIEIRELAYGPDWQFQMFQPDIFHVRDMSWDSTQVKEGAHVGLNFLAANYASGVFKLEAVQIGSRGEEIPVSLDSLGIPAVITPQGAQSHVDWIARRPSSGAPSPNYPEIVVRLVDHTASAPALKVLPPDGPPPPPPPPPEHGPPPRIPADPGGDVQNAGSLARLDHSPLGRVPTLLIRLPSATHARLDLYDLAGRRIRNLLDRELPKGPSVVTWDGRSSDGSAARAGIYFARLTLPRVVRTVSVVQPPR